MKRKTFTGYLISYGRRNCSYYGNPKFRGTFENPETGEWLSGTTATDAQCAYGFLNGYGNNQLKEIEYHITRTGNVIFDYIRKVK